jgi:hypothetical protein
VNKALVLENRRSMMERKRKQIQKNAMRMLWMVIISASYAKKHNLPVAMLKTYAS